MTGIQSRCSRFQKGCQGLCQIYSRIISLSISWLLPYYVDAFPFHKLSFLQKKLSLSLMLISNERDDELNFQMFLNNSAITFGTARSLSQGLSVLHVGMSKGG